MVVVGPEQHAALQRAFERLQSMDPRTGQSASLPARSDADVDMWAEDSYLAGLVTSYLKSGTIAVTAIYLDGWIDQQLATLSCQSTGDDKRTADRYIAYREQMLVVARLLAEVSERPLMERSAPR